MKSVKNRVGSNLTSPNIKKDSYELVNTTYKVKQTINRVLKTTPLGYGGNNRCTMRAKGGA